MNLKELKGLSKSELKDEQLRLIDQFLNPETATTKLLYRSGKPDDNKLQLIYSDIKEIERLLKEP